VRLVISLPPIKNLNNKKNAVIATVKLFVLQISVYDYDNKLK